MRYFVIKIVISAIIFICGCAPSFYTYKNVRYDTKEAAIQAQQKDLSRISGQIEGRKRPVYGKALLILPSREARKDRGFRGATREHIENPANQETVDFILDTAEKHQACLGTILENYGLFENVEIERALYPGEKAFNNRASYDAIIYVKLEGQGRVGCYLITPKSVEEQLVFVRNALPSNAPGFRFWLNRIEQRLEDQQHLPILTSADSVKTLENSMKTELPSKSAENTEDEELSSTAFDDEPALDQTKGVTYYVEFNPFLYEWMYSTKLGVGEHVAIYDFSDKREGSDENDNHIGTIYGAVYHNPLFKIHSERPVSDAITDAVETLFMANAFKVNKYQTYSQEKDERFLVRGAVNKLWVGCFHDAKATVDIDMEIYDVKEKRVIWDDKIAYEETADPSKVLLVPLLNRTLGKAFHIAWTKSGMSNLFSSLGKKEKKEQIIKNLETDLSVKPNDAASYLRLGIAHYDAGNYVKAEKALNHAIELNANNARAHYYLGVTQLIQGKKEAAVKEYEILRKLDENFAKKLFQDIYE